MTLAHLSFGLYFVIVLCGSVFCVCSQNLVRSLVGLIATLLGVAGMYLLMQAPFLALMQILIYLGAVCVLIFFALMLIKDDPTKAERPFSLSGKNLHALVPGLFALLVLIPPLVLDPAESFIQPKQVSVGELGRALLEEYLLPFELIAVILLVAMAGGVLLAWDRRKR